jgi:hypothetical protein
MSAQKRKVIEALQPTVRPASRRIVGRERREAGRNEVRDAALGLRPVEEPSCALSKLSGVARSFLRKLILVIVFIFPLHIIQVAIPSHELSPIEPH